MSGVIRRKMSGSCCWRFCAQKTVPQKQSNPLSRN